MSDYTSKEKPVGTNWNKPMVARQTIYVSTRLRRFLSRKSIDKQGTLDAWLKVVHARVVLLAAANAGATTAASIMTEPIQLLGKIVARAYAEAQEEDEQIPYNVHIAFDDETISKIAWQQIYVEKK